MLLYLWHRLYIVQDLELGAFDQVSCKENEGGALIEISVWCEIWWQQDVAKIFLVIFKFKWLEWRFNVNLTTCKLKNLSQRQRSINGEWKFHFEICKLYQPKIQIYLSIKNTICTYFKDLLTYHLLWPVRVIFLILYIYSKHNLDNLFGTFEDFMSNIHVLACITKNVSFHFQCNLAPSYQLITTQDGPPSCQWTQPKLS